MKREDDFAASVIRNLRDRVAHRCSNPTCRVPTSAPGARSSDKSVNLGKAAHICAASEGGPRYVKEMTSEQRRDISNAIWLCSNCATVIDVDVDRYSIDLLREWRRQAEATALLEYGRRLPREEDARDQVLYVLRGAPSSFKRTAIANAHHATECVLTGLDPRFAVETGFSKGATTISLHAQETVPFSINVDAERSSEWRSAISALFEHGQDVRLPKSGILLHGSPLFDELVNSQPDGTLQILGAKRSANLKFALSDPSGDRSERFDDVQGQVSGGTKSFSFRGASCAGTFEVAFSAPFDGVQSDGKFSIACEFAPWLGRDIRFLPYIDRLEAIFDLAIRGWKVDFDLEIDGISQVRARSGVRLGVDDLEPILGAIRYVKRCGEIARFLGAEVRFELGHGVSEDDYIRIADVANIIRGCKVYEASDLACDPVVHVVASSDCVNIEALACSQEADHRMKVQYDGGSVLLFGTELALPMLEISLDDVQPKLPEDLSSIEPGTSVPVRLLRGPDFKCKYAFVKSDQPGPAVVTE
jgi:hypothetical protein